MAKVGALELVGRYKGDARCIRGVKLNSIPRSKVGFGASKARLGYACRVGEGILG